MNTAVNPDERATPWTYAFLVAIAIGYAAQLYLGDAVMLYGALWPLGDYSFRDGSQIIEVGFAPWQLVTYAFLHGSPTHLLFNALALWMFGRPIERTFGRRRFALYWFVCVIGAAVAQLIVQGLAGGDPIPTVGASGGVFGLLLAFGSLFPKARIMLLFPPIPMPAWLFVIGYGLVELYLGISGKQAEVAHFAHLGGMIAGIPFVVYWRRQLLMGKPLWRE